MVLALTMAPETMAFQLRPQYYTTRMKGTSQHFQNNRDDLPERVTAVECNLSSMQKTLDRIEKSILRLDTKIDKLSVTTYVIAFLVFGLYILTGMVNLPQLVGLFK
jgi:hypothetical protein